MVRTPAMRARTHTYEAPIHMPEGMIASSRPTCSPESQSNKIAVVESCVLSPQMANLFPCLVQQEFDCPNAGVSTRKCFSEPVSSFTTFFPVS
ncbi:hypothetical protein D3C85_1462430 [compost metagenome]